MKTKPNRAAGILAVCLIFLLLGLVGCASKERPLFWYESCSFPFEMTLNADGESFVMKGQRTPTSVTVTLIAPENLAGLTVAYTGGSCVLSVGEIAIPMSEEAAFGLTVLLDGLLLSSAEGAELSSTAEGWTVVTFDALTVTMDEHGLPALLLHRESGREASLVISEDTVTK